MTSTPKLLFLNMKTLTICSTFLKIHKQCYRLHSHRTSINISKYYIGNRGLRVDNGRRQAELDYK